MKVGVLKQQLRHRKLQPVQDSDRLQIPGWNSFSCHIIQNIYLKIW